MRTRLAAFLPVNTPLEPAPYGEDQPYPACVYKLMNASGNHPQVDGYLVKENLDYLIVGMAVANTQTGLIPIIKAIGQAFGNPGGQGISGTNEYGTVFAVRILRAHSIPYLSNSKKVYQSSGFIVRFIVKGNYT